MTALRPALAAGIVILFVLAGCLAEPSPSKGSTAGGGRGPGGAAATPGGIPVDRLGARVQVYDKDGLAPLTIPDFPTPIEVSVSTVLNAAGQPADCREPTGGVTWNNDYIYNVCLAQVYRSKDHGATWQVISTQLSSPTTLDPYMWVDWMTNRVYSVQLYLACSYLSYTDNDGATWITNPAACGLPVNDHQTMAGGPPAPPAVATPVYRNFLYYCVNQLQDTMCAKSFDGGLTWTGMVAQLTAFDVETGGRCSAINGHVWVGKDGTVYLPKRTCNRPSVVVSTTNGITWEEKVVSRAHPVVQSLAHDPTITTDSESNASYYWTGDDGILRMSTSKNKGQAWSAPVRVSPPGMTMPMFETSVAGDPGRVAVAYYGTFYERKEWKYASDAPSNATWHLYLSMLENALDENPRITTIQVNPSDDPIQRGCIWLQGGGGGPASCRNLLDFFDISMGKDGRVYVHYTDGCVRPECVNWSGTGYPARDRAGGVAIVQAGPSLFQDPGWLAPFPAPATTS